MFLPADLPVPEDDGASRLAPYGQGSGLTARATQMSIGDLAERAGVSLKAVRNHESLGLLAPVQQYNAEALHPRRPQETR